MCDIQINVFGFTITGWCREDLLEQVINCRTEVCFLFLGGVKWNVSWWQGGMWSCAAEINFAPVMFKCVFGFLHVSDHGGGKGASCFDSESYVLCCMKSLQVSLDMVGHQAGEA